MSMRQQQVLGVSQKMEQTLRMSPQMQQAIKMLQLTHQEMLQLFENEMDLNPALEYEEAPEDLSATSEATENMPEVQSDLSRSEELPVIDLEEYFSDRGSPREESVYSWEQQSNYEEYTSWEPTLTDHLMEQLRVAVDKPKEFEIGRFLIENISDAGFLTISLDEAARCLGVEVQDIIPVFDIIKTFSPDGVGARDLSECLIIQFRALKLDDPVAEKIILDHLEELGRNRIPDIARHIGVKVEEVYSAVELIKMLNPRPGFAFAGRQEAKNTKLKIDVEAVLRDGKYVVELNWSLPRLRVLGLEPVMRKLRDINSRLGGNKGSDNPAELEHERQQLEEYARKCISDAKFKLEAAEQGQNTIREIAQAIVDYQTDFLDKGIEYLRPLKLRDIADQIGRHEATVSRVTRGRYMKTPRGVFELKYFFSGGVRDHSQIEDTSTRSIQEKIRQVIEGEDPKKPLSDKKIVDILKGQGVRIARRTVAKYRELMGIPSTSIRRKH